MRYGRMDGECRTAAAESRAKYLSSGLMGEDVSSTTTGPMHPACINCTSKLRSHAKSVLYVPIFNSTRTAIPGPVFPLPLLPQLGSLATGCLQQNGLPRIHICAVELYIPMLISDADVTLRTSWYKRYKIVRYKMLLVYRAESRCQRITPIDPAAPLPAD